MLKLGYWASSKGSGVVPDLNGLTPSAARVQIIAAGFTLGTETVLSNADGATSSNDGLVAPNADAGQLKDYESPINFSYYSYSASSGGGGGTTYPTISVSYKYCDGETAVGGSATSSAFESAAALCASLESSNGNPTGWFCSDDTTAVSNYDPNCAPAPEVWYCTITYMDDCSTATMESNMDISASYSEPYPHVISCSTSGYPSPASCTPPPVFGFVPFGFTPFGFTPAPAFSFVPFGFTPSFFSFTPFGFTPSFFSFTPFGFTPSFFSFTPEFSFTPFNFTPFSFTPFSFTPFGFTPGGPSYV